MQNNTVRSKSFASGNETGMLIIDRKTGTTAMELSGIELDEYCRNRGLCNRCAKVVTHKRVVKLFGKDVKWEPLTIRTNEYDKEKLLDNNNENPKSSHDEYAVYKGYCLKEHTCYTMAEAKRLLGEADGPKSRRSFKLSISQTVLKRPGKRRMRTNPETGSLSGSVVSGISQFSGMSTGTSATKSSVLSGLSRVSGFSTRSRNSFSKNNFRNGSKKTKKKSSSGSHSVSGRSITRRRSRDSASIDGSEITVDDLELSARTAPPNTETEEKAEVSPMVAHRVDQLINFDYFVVLYLSKVDLGSKSATGRANIDAIVDALKKAQTLEAITLEYCKLDDEAMEKLAEGLEGHFAKSKGPLKALRLKGNRIGNRGAQALEFLFRSSTSLEELDLSDNRIGSKGAASVLDSLGQNRAGIPLSILNLAQNEIWDLSGNSMQPKNNNSKNHRNHHGSYSFLHTNSTLLELNLEGNCLHDEGAEYLADAIYINRHHCVLSKLYLGYNGIGDSGITCLAKALESNASIKVLGLSQNDITNNGARALLSALAVNVSVKEISGLYDNLIDRTFIITAIKRLLHRGANEDSRAEDQDEHHEGTESTTFSSSTSDEGVQPAKQNGLSSSMHSNGSVALEAIENWDWGTFGIEEIEETTNPETQKADQQLKDINEQLPLVDESLKSAASTAESSSKGTSQKQQPVDRLVVFQSAPLAYFDRKTMQHHGVPLLDFGHEAEALRSAFVKESAKGSVEVVFETATQNNLNNAFGKSWSPVLHFSCYGSPDCISLENGFGYMQALPLDALKKMVASAKAAAANQVELVVVASCHAQQLAEALLNAGIPRVVALSRDATTFRDDGPIEFSKAFYSALQESKTLQEAFDIGIKESGKRDPSLSHSYKLLPEEANHDVEIFYQHPPAPMKKSGVPMDIIRDEDPMAILPKAPEHFFGREVDVYELLESLRVDDVIKIGGAKGSGKKSILSVLSRYILERSTSFQIDSVFWLPPPSGVAPKSNTLYGDLCLVFQWIMAAEDDIWEDLDYKGARERILIEMESRNSILVIDGRVFTNEIAGEMLERFLTHVLNEVNVKIILITASDAKPKRTSSEENTVYLGPLDLRSTVKLYANACPLIASPKDDDNTIDTVVEFERFLLPDAPASNEKPNADPKAVDSKAPELSKRQSDLFEAMGSGNPEQVLRIASSCTPDTLSELLKIAQRPEVSVSTSKELEDERNKWIALRDHAIESKYYLRATDIEKTLEELEELKKVYPSLEDMKAKEADLKKTFTNLLKAKRYDDANFVKRKILTLKRSMMKEKNSLSASENTRKADALDSINEIQQRMKNMMALAESMNESATSFSAEGDFETVKEASFFVSDGCTLEISSDSLSSFWNGASSKTNESAMIVWVNEACDLSGTDEETKKLLGDDIEKELASVDACATTQWGPVKCATGDSLAMNSSDGKIVLAVPPLLLKDNSSKKNDENKLWYTENMLSSAIRSSFRKIRQSHNGDLVIGVSTISDDASSKIADATEDRSLNRNLAVTLHSVVKELRRAKDSDAKTVVKLFASSGPAESLELIRIATENGLPIAEVS